MQHFCAMPSDLSTFKIQQEQEKFREKEGGEKKGERLLCGRDRGQG